MATPMPMSAPKGGGKLLTVGKVSLLSRLAGIWRVIIILLILSVLVTAIVISIEAKDITPGIQYLGNKTLLVTENLNEQSLSVIENGGLYEKSDSFFTNMINFFKSIWKFIIAIIVIYVWLKVLTWIFLKAILMDDGKTTSAFLLAVLFFVMIQVLFIAIFTDKSMMTPIHAFINLVKSMPYIFKPISTMADKLIG